MVGHKQHELFGSVQYDLFYSVFDQYDFFDFGSGKGGCMQFATKKLGGVCGLGFESHEGRNKILNTQGHKCICEDVTKINLPKNAVNFVTMSHLLEHLHTYNDARKIIHLGMHTARDFVFIEGPSFDFDSYLHSLGFKFFWFDGCGHTLRITIDNIVKYVRQKDFYGVSLLTERPFIGSSVVDDIHPLTSLPSQLFYDKDKHPPKPIKEFKDRNVFRSFILFVWLKKINIDKYINSRAKFKLAWTKLKEEL